MQDHRWNGRLSTILGLTIACPAGSASESRTLLRAANFAMAALVLVQGFLGGEHVHGPDHLGISGFEG
jgi:heme A synthase|tara:strand:+ start:706 stop:909 length:204 start_codon:yes stop_codon:yes gene_type:complete